MLPIAAVEKEQNKIRRLTFPTVYVMMSKKTEVSAFKFVCIYRHSTSFNMRAATLLVCVACPPFCLASWFKFATSGWEFVVILIMLNIITSLIVFGFNSK